MKIKKHFREDSRLRHFAEFIFYYVFISLFTFVLILLYGIFALEYVYLLILLPIVSSCMILVTLIRAKRAGRNLLTSVKMVSILSLISGVILCGITQFASIILFLILILPTSITGFFLERIIQPPIKNGYSLPASSSSTDSTSASNIILAKVEYYRPQNAGYSISPINVVTRSLTLREDVSTGPICRLNHRIARLFKYRISEEEYEAVRRGDEVNVGYDILLAPSLTIPPNYPEEIGEEELMLNRIDVYMDGVHCSSITFYEGFGYNPERQISIPIIDSAETTLTIPQPVAVNIPRGSHMLMVNFMDSSGKILFADGVQFEIFKWMREGEIWTPVPIRIISRKLGQAAGGLLYYKMDKLTSKQEFMRSILTSSTTVEMVDIDSEEYFITSVELSLGVLDDKDLHSIKIHIDGEEFYKIHLIKTLHLLKNHQYVIKIPHLPPLTLKKGKHAILLKLLKRDPLSKSERILSTRIIEFTYPPAKERKPREHGRKKKKRSKRASRR